MENSNAKNNKVQSESKSKNSCGWKISHDHHASIENRKKKVHPVSMVGLLGAKYLHDSKTRERNICNDSTIQFSALHRIAWHALTM